MPSEPETGRPDRLPPMPWMSDPATQAVIGALEARGGPGAARFVGGCVRNALLDRPIDDIDIATVLAPKAVMAALNAGGVKYVPTGVAHGTVTAIASGRPFEVTTLRRDVETDGRRYHAIVTAFETDRRKDQDLTAAGWRVLRFTAKQVLGEPGYVAATVRACLA